MTDYTVKKCDRCGNEHRKLRTEVAEPKNWIGLRVTKKRDRVANWRVDLCPSCANQFDIWFETVSKAESNFNDLYDKEL